MGTNRTNDYSGFMRRAEDGYEVQVKDEQLKKFFPQRNDIINEPRFAELNPRLATLPDDVDSTIFEDEMWKEYSQRCIACGRCNTSCPTCTCFTVQDISSEDSNNAGERCRIWSSCQVKNFAILAGNHDFRIPKGDRMRYKVLHKIRDFRKITGVNMCVGCGRCEDVCPDYISMFKCVEKIKQITAKKKSNG